MSRYKSHLLGLGCSGQQEFQGTKIEIMEVCIVKDVGANLLKSLSPCLKKYGQKKSSFKKAVHSM